MRVTGGVILLLIGGFYSVQSNDIYDILDIGRDSDPRLVESAFRKAAFKLHPDKNNGATVSEFMSLSDAYQKWKEGLTKKASPLGDMREQQRKKRSVESYVAWAILDGVVGVTVRELFADWQGVYFDATTGMCYFDGTSPYCLATTCPPSYDQIRRSQGWSEPYESFGAPCTSPFGGKLLCCKAALRDRSWGGSWQSTITGKIAHCSFWREELLLWAEETNSTLDPNYCGELDCNIGTSRFTVGTGYSIRKNTVSDPYRF